MTIYQQLTLEDRIRMGELRLQGFSVTRIAERSGRHRSTIYREFQRNFRHVWTHLLQSPKLRRKRYRSYDSRGRMAGKRHPKSVESRRHRGHWEIDAVMGKGSPDSTVTLVERNTGFLMIGKLKDRTTLSLNKKTRRLIHQDPAAFKTITADNGAEFHQYRAIEADRKVRFHFANPYHSWERGPDEDLRLQFEAVSRMPPEKK